VRGRRHGNFGLRADTGLIPACAGQTEGVKAAGAAAGAHPRVCGADEDDNVGVVNSIGSSPRVRGRLMGSIGFPSWWGLIPACAGQTRTWWRCQPLRRAHPRVCGADKGGTCHVERPGGSSPRVRGRLSPASISCPVSGLIPACAGQTRLPRTSGAAPGAHPRVCGADLTDGGTANTLEGSSPRVRGRRDHAFQRNQQAGLIPACAGQT